MLRDDRERLSEFCQSVVPYLDIMPRFCPCKSLRIKPGQHKDLQKQIVSLCWNLFQQFSASLCTHGHAKTLVVLHEAAAISKGMDLPGL